MPWQIIWWEIFLWIKKVSIQETVLSMSVYALAIFLQIWWFKRFILYHFFSSPGINLSIGWCRYLASMSTSRLGSRSYFPSLYQEQIWFPSNPFLAWSMWIWIHSRHVMVPHKMVHEAWIGKENSFILHWKLHSKSTQWSHCIRVIATSWKSRLGGMAMAFPYWYVISWFFTSHIS